MKDFKQTETDNTYNFCKPWFKKNKRIALDIGCDVFQFAGKLEKDFDKIHCFDFRDKFAQIKRYVSDPNKITFHQTGLGETSVTRYTKSGVGRIKAGEIPTSSSNLAVPIRTLDSFGLFDSVDFIKMDVEGYEPKIIQGGLQTIQKNKPVILCEINRGDFTAKHMLEEMGYTCADVYHKLGQPHDYLFVPDPILF